MNQRIKELAAASALYDGWFCGEGNIEEFAKLIIQECAEVASDYDGTHYAGNAIKDHFEVGEIRNEIDDSK